MEHGSEVTVCKRTKKAGKDEWFMAETFTVRTRSLSCANPDGPCFFLAPNVDKSSLKKECRELWEEAPVDLEVYGSLPEDDLAFQAAYVRKIKSQLCLNNERMYKWHFFKIVNWVQGCFTDIAKILTLHARRSKK